MDPGDALGSAVERGDPPIAIDGKDTVGDAIKNGLRNYRLVRTHHALTSHGTTSISTAP
jgi:hypothetical protein